MSGTPICSIRISSKLSEDEIESLETALEMSSIKLQKSPSRAIGADDLVFVATVLGGVTAAANLVEYGIKITRAIAEWRKKVRSQGREPEGRLEHPNRPPLDLSTASDEEIEKWFSQR